VMIDAMVGIGVAILLLCAACLWLLFCVIGLRKRIDLRESIAPDFRFNVLESRLDALELSASDARARLNDQLRALDSSGGTVAIHAPCDLCGKQGHVADMEWMSYGEARTLGLVLDHAQAHLHPECLLAEGCEHVDAVAGGWRRKEDVA